MSQISIIIPVYNDEKYITETLDSVIGQTFSDWQVICINDGSTDNSLKILKQYAKRDKRIQIIDQKNAGVIVARTNGINKAKSPYIFMLDGDDKIASLWYWQASIMMNLITFAIIKHFYKRLQNDKD